MFNIFNMFNIFTVLIIAIGLEYFLSFSIVISESSDRIDFEVAVLSGKGCTI